VLKPQPSFLPRPLDATLSVARAAEALGVHPNTVRAWSDAGRLRYYRINARGDRRYRMGDLQHFLATLAEGPLEDGPAESGSHRPSNGRFRRNSEPGEPLEAPPADDHRQLLSLLGQLGDIAGSAIRDALTNPQAPLAAAVRVIRDSLDAVGASIWRLDGEQLEPVAASGSAGRTLVTLPDGFGVLGEALAATPRVIEADPTRHLSATNQPGREVAVAIAGEADPWGVLLVVRRPDDLLDDRQRELLAATSASVANIVRASQAGADVAHQLHRADALRRVASDIGSRLDLDEILDGLVDHASVLFAAEHAAIYLYEGDRGRRTAASRGLSRSWANAVESVQGTTFGSAAIAARRPLFTVGYRDDPRAGGLRAAIIQEGFDTACVAPLFDGDQAEPLGMLSVYHDRPHPWTEDELDTMAALATQATVAIKTARNYAQLATWAAQLQSIQALGARLNRLTRVRDIGNAIATELRQLIDYHNVRVYRIEGDDLVPVAMLGRVGEYLDETAEQLRVQVGHGITGWVAEHRVAQLLDDASADPRADTIPGTEDDLDESMLLAPMLFEDEVLGVLVLSKLGLRQFRQDDLRLLEIYASFAAQAMANADATQRLHEQSEALEQKVRSQRELLKLTESILATLDTPVLLETIADRLGDLVGSDSLVIELVDGQGGGLLPVTAKGTEAEALLRPDDPRTAGLAAWVLQHNEPVRVTDAATDPRITDGRALAAHLSLLAVPLRRRDGAVGVLTLERIGADRCFSEDEFELVQLFAAQASIALQNAEIHLAVSRKAQMDVLTGLLNHGTFAQQMDELIRANEPFSLVMLDLDHFKPVNDRMGHQAGDRALRQVSDAIVAASRDSDRVYRYGGDEFAVLLPRTDADHVGAVADRLRAAVASVPASAGGRARSWMLDASVGTSSFPADGATFDEVLLAADRALFVAKRSGGARVATASEGLALEGEFTLQTPTPIDPLAAPAA
jgi:diguanylate cyclase (GGDEF)-like protein/excisionase family DNA binding protein